MLRVLLVDHHPHRPGQYQSRSTFPADVPVQPVKSSSRLTLDLHQTPTTSLDLHRHRKDVDSEGRAMLVVAPPLQRNVASEKNPGENRSRPRRTRRSWDQESSE